MLLPACFRLEMVDLVLFLHMHTDYYDRTVLFFFWLETNMSHYKRNGKKKLCPYYANYLFFL